MVLIFFLENLGLRLYLAVKANKSASASMSLKVRQSSKPFLVDITDEAAP